MTTNSRFTADTLETALVLLAEWNTDSRTPVCADKPDDARYIRDAIKTAAALESIERSLRRMAVYACNFPLTEERLAAEDRRASQLFKRVDVLLRPWSVGARFGGDVRGSQIHLLTPKSGRYNTLGGNETGWAV